jgi:hypothetical protein
MRGTLPGRVREEGEIKLGGTNVTVLVFVPADEADPKSFAFAEATMLPSPSGMRLLTCVSRTDGKVQRDRCRRALEYLANHGTPDGAEISAPAPIGKAAIGSRALEVPAGCRVAAANEVAGRLQCESSFLSWNTIEKRLVPSTTRWLEEVLPLFTAPAGGGFSDERIPCRVESMPASCARLTKEVPSKGTFRLYVGTTVVGDHALMVACAFFDRGQGFAPSATTRSCCPEWCRRRQGRGWSGEAAYIPQGWRSVPNPRRCILWALVGVVVGLPSCGSDNPQCPPSCGGGSPQTCLELTITYAGAKSGAAYLRAATDGGLNIAGNAASIQFLILAESGGVTCHRGGNPIDFPMAAAAWIDVSGTEAAICSDLRNPQCQPSPSDPQAHQKVVLRFGQLTRMRLDVVDPP